MQTAGDLADFSVRQENALNVCEGQRDLAVQIVRDQNAASAGLAKAVRPRPWWRVW